MDGHNPPPQGYHQHHPSPSSNNSPYNNNNSSDMLPSANSSSSMGMSPHPPFTGYGGGAHPPQQQQHAPYGLPPNLQQQQQSVPMDVGSSSSEMSASSSSPSVTAIKSEPSGGEGQQVNGGAFDPSMDKQAVMVVLSFLKKNNLKATEELLRKEAQIAESEMSKMLPMMDSDVQSVLSSYASDENPDEYSSAYNLLKGFCDASLDAYKYEVGQVLWPVFVHLYLELVYNEHETQAAQFFTKFSTVQETFYEADLISLGTIKKKEHLIQSENPFKSLTSSIGGGGLVGASGGKSSNSSSGVYVVRMSREALSLLKRFLQEKRLKLIQNIIQDRIFVEVYDGIPRGRAATHATAGYIMGEPLKTDNKAKVYYGLLREPDLQNFQMDEDDDEGGGGGGGGSGTAGGGGDGKDSGEKKGGGGDSSSKEGSSSQQTSSQQSTSSQQQSSSQPSEKSSSKKKKSKKEWFMANKKSKNDPNAPPITRMPLPELRDIDKIEKAKALRESMKRVTLGADRLPSICYYTVLNGDQQVTFIKWSEDGMLMGVGFASSLIRVFSLTPGKLRKLKPAADLADIDREADDVLVRMMDDRSSETDRHLRGHSGPVYSLDFSPDKLMLLSSSEDASIRLWSLLTWTCLVVYKGHLFPVWKAVFSPHGGYYFASAGHDRTARLWATDTPQPLRIFAGHYSDVTSIIFHPNSNYVATGSADRSVRLWDCVSGSCVRLMTGHKGTVQALCFSTDGRFLVSSATDKKVMVWDLANGGLLTILHNHKNIVYSISFSKEGSLFATGGLDHCVRLWDFVKMTEDVMSEEGGATIPPDVRTISGKSFLVGEFYTKSTAVFSLHFTRRNILLASGPFQHNY